MFVLTVSGREDDGAYSVIDNTGEKVLYIFEESDDAMRFALMLEQDGYPEMHVVEIEDDMMMSICDMNDIKYAIITPSDIVIPPKSNDFI